MKDCVYGGMLRRLTAGTYQTNPHNDTSACLSVSDCQFRNVPLDITLIQRDFYFIFYSVDYCFKRTRFNLEELHFLKIGFFVVLVLTCIMTAMKQTNFSLFLPS